MIYKKIIQLILALVLVASTMIAQEKTTGMGGIIKDRYGEPLVGVMIVSENGKNMTTTGADGAFIINVNDDSRYITVNYLGYKSQRLDTDTDQAIEITLKEDVYNQNQMLDLGLNKVEKEVFAGVASTVSGTELEKTPVANLSATLTGRLPGLMVRQTGSSWNNLSHHLKIRGYNTNNGGDDLVVVIDGLIVPADGMQYLNQITPWEIETMTILKDASALALYGMKGANGVIVVNTKRGQVGKLDIDIRAEGTMMESIKKPFRPNSGLYATLKNQAAYNDNPGLGKNQAFTDEQIEKFNSGENRSLYPDNNWYDEYLTNYQYMQRVGINLSAGSEKARFFSNVNFMHHDLPIKVRGNEQYKSSPSYYNVNLRTNLDINLTKYLKSYLNIAANIKRERGLPHAPNTIYQYILYTPPTLFGPVTPHIIDKEGTVVHEGGKILTTPNMPGDESVYRMINRSGYNTFTTTYIYTNAGFELDLAFLTKGLSIGGDIGYAVSANKGNNVGQNRERWIRVIDSPEDWDVYKFEKKGTIEDSPLGYGGSNDNLHNLNLKAYINYNRSFGRHNVTLNGYALYQNLGMPIGSIDEKYIYSGMNLFYDFDKRYAISLGSGYSGSDNFAPGNRFKATPAVSGAWIASNETFIKDNISWLSLLKFKASYGINSNDRIGVPYRYPYLDRFDLSGQIRQGNPLLEPEKVKKQNYGIELGLFNQLYIGFNLYRHRMDNMNISVTGWIPSYHGDRGSYPNVQQGKMSNKGYELELNYTKQFNKDLTISAGGYVAFNKNQFIDTQEMDRGEDYVYPIRTEGYSIGTGWGYLVDYSNGNGFFNTKEELDEYLSKVSYGANKPRVGDLKYQDLNEDGMIDGKDQVPLTKGAIPRYDYAFNISAAYKDFDLSILFQGIGDYKSIVSGSFGFWENPGGGSTERVYSKMHLDSWTQEKYENGETIKYPALTEKPSSSNTSASDFYLLDKSFLRLKNVEIGYTLPRHITRQAKMERVRFWLSGNNLITWDKMGDVDFDPENNHLGEVPVSRSYNIGLSIDF